MDFRIIPLEPPQQDYQSYEYRQCNQNHSFHRKSKDYSSFEQPDQGTLRVWDVDRHPVRPPCERQTPPKLPGYAIVSSASLFFHRALYGHMRDLIYDFQFDQAIGEQPNRPSAAAFRGPAHVIAISFASASPSNFFLQLVCFSRSNLTFMGFQQHMPMFDFISDYFHFIDQLF